MELEQYWQFGAALVFVLALIGVLFWIMQRVGVGGGRGRRGSRLGVVEYATVDKRRRLVLVRRDGVEHLVMIGGPQDVVVESKITKREPALAGEMDVAPVATVAAATGGAALAAAAGEPRLSATADAAQRAEAPVAEEPDVSALPREDVPPQYHRPTPSEPAPGRPEPAARAMEPSPPRRMDTEPPRPDPAPPAPSVEVDRDEPVRAESTHVEPPRAQQVPSGPAVMRERRQQQQAEQRPGPQDSEPPEAEPQSAAPGAPDQHPWPPSEGRFREAQRRFAERNEQPHPPARSDNPQDNDYGPHHPEDRKVASAGHSGMPELEAHGEPSQDGPPREPANLNVRPGEDR
jgi:hypothetical protein